MAKVGRVIGRRGRGRPTETTKTTGEHSAPSKVLDPDCYEISAALAELTEANSAIRAVFDEMADQVISRHIALGCRAMALCGASQGTGVTFTATNLAVALSRRGIETLLIDANFYMSGLEYWVRPQVSNGGLQQVLRAELTRADALHSQVMPGLSLLYSGGVAAEGHDLLIGEGFRALLQENARDFECTILDTPPANRFADSRTIAAAVGYAAVVGRRNYTYLDDALLLSKQLNDDGVKVIGSIFNAA